jgi:hypothetical protein
MLAALVSPRGLFVIENDIDWLGPVSCVYGNCPDNLQGSGNTTEPWFLSCWWLFLLCIPQCSDDRYGLVYYTLFDQRWKWIFDRSDKEQRLSYVEYLLLMDSAIFDLGQRLAAICVHLRFMSGCKNDWRECFCTCDNGEKVYILLD